MDDNFSISQAKRELQRQIAILSCRAEGKNPYEFVDGGPLYLVSKEAQTTANEAIALIFDKIKVEQDDRI